MIIIAFFLVIINLFLWAFVVSNSVGVMTKQRLARRRKIVALIIIVFMAIAIIYPVLSMLGGSVSSKQVSRTVPEVKLGDFFNIIKTMSKNLVPIEGKRVKIDQEDIDRAFAELPASEGKQSRENSPYSVYNIEIDGENLHLAKIGKVGKQWLYMTTDSSRDTYLAAPASEEQRVKAVVFTWSNFPDALSKGDFGRYVINSMILVVINTIGALLSATLVAYGFSRFKFKGRNWLFIVLLSTMMLPAQVSLIPSFIIYTKLGWYGTYLPLTVAAYFAASPWNVFLMRQFFMGLPLELDEAAKIDGCGPFGILFKVIVPQSTAVMLTITLSTAVFWWNDYFYSLIYLQDQKMYPVALGLTAFDAKYFNNSALKAAATVMMLVPPVMMFFFFQKFFIQGTVISGVKG
ncbi:MAG: carbohydrate ABC transporter permease [Sphaerochaetaceae bacterium]|nr:carbohydrate ABC transporter permease [Sphaerochaetaceae bacterium]